MPILARLLTGIKALRQLGFEPVALNALYRFGVVSGHYRRGESRESRVERRGEKIVRGEGGIGPEGWPVLDLYGSPADARTEEDRQKLVAAAEEIVSGQVRLFGGEPVALRLAPPSFQLAHWTDYERGRAHWGDEPDIKLVWEPARFDWAYTLARAYLLSPSASGMGLGDRSDSPSERTSSLPANLFAQKGPGDRYAQAFWEYTETFIQANPPNRGPHWISGQEVALRLLAWIYAAPIFTPSPHSTPARTDLLRAAIADHARRIPPTLVYARSQNNNHLISEAVGLYAAGLFLPDHPAAESWRSLGWKWLNHAFQTQIAADGTYAQHSSNYHRLMLTLGLWVAALSRVPGGQALPAETLRRLASATHWLAERVDPATGAVPNLGANDGAWIAPLAEADYGDFRPVLHAAQRAFLAPAAASTPQPAIDHNLRWSMRAVHFSSRPSHADQLHVDIRWRDVDFAGDPGTFSYNAPPPWDNPLSGTAFHNTLSVDGQDQMTRAGRFLWLDWAQAEILTRETALDGSLSRVTACHSGYQHLGVVHQRQVTRTGPLTLEVCDQLLPAWVRLEDRRHTARLHWLLPDWPFQVGKNTLSLQSPWGWVRIELEGSNWMTLVRAGQTVAGDFPTNEPAPHPAQGWKSPTYQHRVPALALLAGRQGGLPMMLVTHFSFPE
jgi:hypothetical protein